MALTLVHVFDRAAVGPRTDGPPGEANLLETAPAPVEEEPVRTEPTPAPTPLEPRRKEVASRVPTAPSPVSPVLPSVASAPTTSGLAVKPPTAVVKTLLAAPGLNKFGNPEGKGLGLAAPGEFQGARLLVWSAEPEALDNAFTDDNPLWAALKDKGFEVRMERGRFRTDWLRDADQLWIFTGQQAALTETDVSAVIAFADSGKGLYLLAENEPFLVDAHRIVQRMYGSSVTGDYPGMNLIAVRGHGVTRDDLRRSGLPKTFNANAGDARSRLAIIEKATHYAEEHPLLTDVNFISEGHTISHIDPTPRLQTVLKASDGQILAAVSRDPRQRVIVDCGYTRYCYSRRMRLVTETAGTLRYAENIAAYLMGKDDKGADGSKWKERRRLLAKYETAAEAEIVAAFRSADPDERWAALTAALRRKLNVPGPLIGLLDDGGPDIRGQARRALVQLADGQDYGPLPNASAGEKDAARLAWTSWLNRVRLLEQALTLSDDEIVVRFRLPNPDERGAAVTAALRRGLDLPDAYIALLRDADPEIRSDAHRALVQLARGEDHGPAPDASEPTRDAAIDDWHRWRVVRKYPALATTADYKEVSAALHSASADQRRAAVLTIRKRRMPLMNDLIDSLNDSEVAIQQDARQTLKLLAAGEDHGPLPNDPPEAIAQAVSGWKTWWNRKEQKVTSQMMKLAKSLLKRNPEAARSRLQEIIDQHGGTDAAREAQDLLENSK